MPWPPQPILIAGYTARMLAELAVKAGYQAVALDYFGDYDLQALVPSVSLLRSFAGKHYSPRALARAARDVAAPAVAYGASFENHPELVAELAEGRALLGNTPATLERVRDPRQLEAAVRAGGFAFPRTLPVGADDPADAGQDISTKTRGAQRKPEDKRPGAPGAAEWLWKPMKSGGGHGVRRLRRGGPARGAGLVQERVAGKVCSAVFAADGQGAVVLGLTEQLVGRRAFGASGYRYCGNLVPPRLLAAGREAMLAETAALVSCLARAFGLRGVNGLDFIWSGGRAWTLEVNPRPSAPLELIDRLYNVRTFDVHARACAGELPGFDLRRAWAGGAGAAGKAILFADRDVTMPDTGDWAARGLRDVPHPGERIQAPHPVCTLLEYGATPGACLRQLREKAERVRSWFVEEATDG